MANIRRSRHGRSTPCGPPTPTPPLSGHPIGHGRYPKNPDASATAGLGYLHRHHRRRKVGPRRHPIQIVNGLFLRSASKSSMDCLSTPAAPLLALALSYAYHTSHFKISKGLSCGSDMPTRFLPGQRPVVRANRSTDEPAPSLHPDYQAFLATTSRAASGRRDGTQRLTVSAARRTPSRCPMHSRPQRSGIGVRIPTFHAEAADRARAASTPDTTWPIDGHPPSSSRTL